LLRQRTEFVWNATFLRRDFRQTAIQLCRRYGARVRIIWLEASLEELRRRNRLRPKSVPDEVYDKRPRKIDFPTPLEAEKLDINPAAPAGGMP
ncbi:MAG: AAA family ATPase, partial [Thermoguttaceae bacterium]|nr:AAA family ATPase [Thermoguttaceae bacterium]